MSVGQVERLQDLLTRVQSNRNRPRAAHGPAHGPAKTARAASTATPVGTAAPSAAATAAAQPMAAREAARAPVPRERVSVVEERVSIPDRASMPQRAPGARAPSQAVQPPARESLAQEAQAMTARKPMRDRTATPLEMAVEGELNRPAEPASLAMPAAPPAQRAASSSTERHLPAVAEAASSSELGMPLTFDAETIAEAARPIAQVVSKHAPAVDATFGAMLKRSLSLRPH